MQFYLNHDLIEQGSVTFFNKREKSHSASFSSRYELRRVTKRWYRFVYHATSYGHKL